MHRLVQQAQTGDVQAFGSLYDRFERSIYGLCYQLLGDADAAADATQQTFVAAFERMRRLRHPEAFSSWLRSAAVNACRHHRRKTGRQRSWTEVFGGSSDAETDRPEPADAAPAVPDRAEAAELSEVVRAALARLSAPHREVIVLHHLQGLPLEEIAESLGVAVGTVKSRLARGREHLERLLSPYVEESDSA